MEGLIFGILRYIQSIIRTFQGNRETFELAGVRAIGSSKQINPQNKEMGWGMNATNMNTLKLDTRLMKK